MTACLILATLRVECSATLPKTMLASEEVIDAFAG